VASGGQSAGVFSQMKRASGSMNRLMSQAQAKRSTQSCARVAQMQPSKSAVSHRLYGHGGRMRLVRREALLDGQFHLGDRLFRLCQIENL